MSSAVANSVGYAARTLRPSGLIDTDTIRNKGFKTVLLDNILKVRGTTKLLARFKAVKEDQI